jgi:hypothetical protein
LLISAFSSFFSSLEQIKDFARNKDNNSPNVTKKAKNNSINTLPEIFKKLNVGANAPLR